MPHDLIVSGPASRTDGPSPPPQPAPAAFEQQVATMLSTHERERAERLHAVAERMSERAAAEASFAETKPLLRDRVLRPRVDALARPFAHAHVDDGDTTVGVHARLVLDRTDQFPVTATLTAGALLDADRALVRLFTKTELVPLLIAAEPHAWRDVPLDTAVSAARGTPGDVAVREWDAAVRWLDERLLAFLRTYLDTASDPHYQQMSTHVDPVCGMTIHAGTVATHHTVRGHPYYFCSAACAEQFARDPAYYLERRRERLDA